MLFDNIKSHHCSEVILDVAHWLEYILKARGQQRSAYTTSTGYLVVSLSARLNQIDYFIQVKIAVERMVPYQHYDIVLTLNFASVNFCECLASSIKTEISNVCKNLLLQASCNEDMFTGG